MKEESVIAATAEKILEECKSAGKELSSQGDYGLEICVYEWAARLGMSPYLFLDALTWLASKEKITCHYHGSGSLWKIALVVRVIVGK